MIGDLLSTVTNQPYIDKQVNNFDNLYETEIIIFNFCQIYT